MLLTETNRGRPPIPVVRTKRGRSGFVVLHVSARLDSKDLARIVRQISTSEIDQARARRRWQEYEKSFPARIHGTQSRIQISQFASEVVEKKILEEYQGFVVKVEEPWAYVTLKTSQGEEFAGTYPVTELTAQGVHERDQFTLTTFEQGGGVFFDVKLIPRQEVSPAERRAIRERIERELGDYSTDDDY